jgi:plasmid stabilization system protein ParE
MIYRVDLTFRAERDVDRILQWLSERSPQGAATWDRRWQQVLDDLRTSAPQ